MAEYKTYRKEKRLYFVLAIVFYFVPFVAVTACLLPMMTEASGLKTAIGFGIVIINAVPFITGVFRAFFAHFPMLNLLSILFIMLAAFFTLELFKRYVEIFLWIELSAAIGSILSCVFWAKYRKYADYQRSVKANVKSGAFVLKEDKDK